ncbi:hypothetical protein GYH30_000623 [Glycine max]|uniref:ATP-dependent DNA helicase n=1 Tax=Glycine max TaxID=3847 RepID=K7K239_SOYBN|nr:hypothetical protein GYH30_000623 [Glycine max]
MQCRHCNAKMWYNENISKCSNTSSPRFNLCCGDGKVELPLLQNPPKFLQQAYIVSNLQKMLDENNAHAKSFRMARDRLIDTEVHNVRLKLIAGREKDGRTYNVPSVPEVAALIAGDIDANSNKDIIVKTQNGQLQRIHELHCSYLALQYPLLFPYGEDGYRSDIVHRDTLSGKKRKRNRLTMREWFAYRLQCRPNEGQTLLHSTKLFQQFVAEGYTMIESERLSYVRNNQKKLRVDKFYSLIILPSTFVGSPRYMDQLYFDGIAICSHVGFPNIFITFTCNPNWPEILRLLTPLNLTAIDKPEIISQIFKLKYEQMLSDLTKNHLLGKVIAFDFIQKRFQATTLIDGDGYPVYRRRNTGRTITKNGIIIDNRWIVPYNPKLLKKYQAHINIEWCNQSTSIKYLFKYINKGYDRVTTVMVHDDNGTVPHANTPNDEIKYISPCESTWRIFGFPIHGRKPSVERLQFHLPGQHSVLYQDHDDINDLLSNPGISESKFIAWMNTNQVFVEGQSLTYSEFVTKFVYNQKQRCWQLRKKGYTTGRLQWVPPTTGELFYLRMMLTVCRGPISFENIRTVDGVEYSTYREACFAMGFSQDDREFIVAIQEAKDWGSAPYLRNLFVLLLLTDQQAKIYNQIIQAVNKNEGGMFFLYGYEGTGKTFIWKTLAASLRADNKIVIMTASSSIASLLLPRGKIAHSKLKIPVPIFEDSTCNIHQGSQLAELLNEASLISWDEAPMAHKFCFEALDRSLRDVIKAKSSSDKIFGGKVMVFGGDFWQILPVIPRRSRSDIVNATINSSYLWNHFHVLTLSKNMRLEANTDATDREETAAFAEWILNIDLLITKYDDSLYAIVNYTFPNLCHHHTNPEYFQTRAILASTNETVQQVNDYILSLIPEFLNSLTTSGLLNHNIKIKIGSPIMLLRNLDQTQGLCNGTRLIVTKLAKHVIAADIISAKNIGQNVYIPRMSMSPLQSP